MASLEEKCKAFIAHSVKMNSMTPPMNCRELFHNGLTCTQYAKFKLKTIFVSVFKVMVVSCLLPSLAANYNKLSKNRIIKILRKFFMATIALTLCTWMPPVVGCQVSRNCQSGLKRYYSFGFFLGGVAMSLDSKNR